ncbi:hypothetical protein GCM10010464_30960 [Pseudonocardia yunnanensis]|uniref:Uncharacterized protein n=1 Tax=Pseudonocardia yunnanensis TaxID=58107 RepID=A0ABW4ETQ5_9PSEU
MALGDSRAVAELRRDDRWWDSLNECLDRGVAGSPQVDSQSAESDHDGVRSQVLTRADTWESQWLSGQLLVWSWPSGEVVEHEFGGRSRDRGRLTAERDGQAIRGGQDLVGGQRGDTGQ